MPVVAAALVNYKQPINWPARLEVALSCLRLGNSSITTGHRITEHGNDSRLFSDGHVVLVWMDPTRGKPVPLPEAIREAIKAAA